MPPISQIQNALPEGLDSSCGCDERERDREGLCADQSPGVPARERRPIRVALIVHTFHVGGLERCVARLASRLDRQWFSPLVICLNRNDAASQWITVKDVPVLEIGKRPGNDPRSVWRLAQMLRREKVDIIHSHNWGTLVESAVARRLAGVPVHVHAERGMEIEDLRCSGWRRIARDRVKRLAMRSADSVVAVSQSIRQHLAERKILSAENVEVIPNGVERVAVDSLHSREAIRRRFQIDEETILVGSVGRLAAVKDFGAVIRAVDQLAKRGRKVQLVLVGNGAERDRLEALQRELGCEARCHFVGQQSNIGDWLAAMDLYVNCSLNEGMSQSVLEAMAAAKPLVVTQVGDSARLVGGEEPCGFLVPASDLPALTEKIDTLVQDASLREKLGKRAATRHAKEYSAETMLTRYEEFYPALLGLSSQSEKGAFQR